MFPCKIIACRPTWRNRFPEEDVEQKSRGIRFGVIAVERGFITAEQLFAALKLQVEENLNSASHRLIGMILMDQGLLTLDQIDEILKEMD